MDQAGAVFRRHVIAGDDRPAVRAGSRTLGAVIGVVEIVEDREVTLARKLATLESLHDLRFFAQFLRVCAKTPLSDNDILAGNRGLKVSRNAHDHVVDGRANGDSFVRGQGPRGRSPDQDQFALVRALNKRLFEAHTNGNRVVLTILVDLVIHLELMVGQRGAVVPAVRQNAVALVGKILVIEGLECPDDRLHVVRVERLVVVREVNPASLAGDIVFPLVRVTKNRRTAGLVELLDAEATFAGDLSDIFDAEDTLRLKFSGQTVRVPAETAFNAVAEHRLVATNNVLDVAGQKMTVVRKSVSKGRAVVEHELVLTTFASRARLNGLTEGIVIGPKGQGFAFHLREGRACVHLVVAVTRVKAVLRHCCPRLFESQGRGPASLGPAVPPRLLYHPDACAPQEQSRFFYSL